MPNRLLSSASTSGPPAARSATSAPRLESGGARPRSLDNFVIDLTDVRVSGCWVNLGGRAVHADFLSASSANSAASQPTVLRDTVARVRERQGAPGPRPAVGRETRSRCPPPGTTGSAGLWSGSDVVPRVRNAAPAGGAAAGPSGTSAVARHSSAEDLRDWLAICKRGGTGMSALRRFAMDRGLDPLEFSRCVNSQGDLTGIGCARLGIRRCRNLPELPHLMAFRALRRSAGYMLSRFARANALCPKEFNRLIDREGELTSRGALWVRRWNESWKERPPFPRLAELRYDIPSVRLPPPGRAPGHLCRDPHEVASPQGESGPNLQCEAGEAGAEPGGDRGDWNALARRIAADWRSVGCDFVLPLGNGCEWLDAALLGS